MVLGVLAVVTLLWFRGFAFHTWMGDDLYAWAYFGGRPSFHELFLTASGGKYRPVTIALQWALFRVFPSDFAAWTYFNTSLEFLTACLVFALVLRVTRRDLFIAFIAALLFLTSRFSYYNVFQVMGTMEALGMLLLVLVLFAAVTYLRSDKRWPGFALVGLFLAISLTHERYLALFPFLILLIVFKDRMVVACPRRHDRPPLHAAAAERRAQEVRIHHELHDGHRRPGRGFRPDGCSALGDEGRREPSLGQLGDPAPLSGITMSETSSTAGSSLR